MIACIVICTIVSLFLNFCLVTFALVLAIKGYSKLIVDVIDECEKIDKVELFVKQWAKHNKQHERRW